MVISRVNSEFWAMSDIQKYIYNIYGMYMAYIPTYLALSLSLSLCVSVSLSIYTFSERRCCVSTVLINESGIALIPCGAGDSN